MRPGAFEQFDRADEAPEAPARRRSRRSTSASVCSRLSSSTISETSSVIFASSALRLLERQPPFPHFAVERDLDVHFIVRAIDAGAIVDEVGVDPAALLRELDPAGLRDAEVGAFADGLGADFVAVGADRVVGGVADVDVRSASTP